jgi:hypothetical protein
MSEYSDVNFKPIKISGQSTAGKLQFNLRDYFYKEVYLD